MRPTHSVRQDRAMQHFGQPSTTTLVQFIQLSSWPYATVTRNAALGFSQVIIGKARDDDVSKRWNIMVWRGSGSSLQDLGCECSIMNFAYIRTDSANHHRYLVNNLDTLDECIYVGKCIRISQNLERNCLKHMLYPQEYYVIQRVKG